ncbi:hypothetical protein KKF55_00390 [Patescibacteria group bacterium]|nr:hypothetical protein [Patescibacteria group bacterium]
MLYPFYLQKSKKCVCGKNPVRADLFVRFFCGFLETANRLEMRRRSGGRIFATAAIRLAQFRSYFVQQLQPIGTIWSLAQRAPAFSRFVPRRAVLPRADARTAHTFFRFFP